MLVTKKSMISGQENTLDLDVTPEQMFRINTGTELIQRIVPHLQPHEREFLMTGITSEEWDNMFGEIEDN
jgi:7,8-dihydro-6-hydroxymethylpterin-pyrophosphokinase